MHKTATKDSEMHRVLELALEAGRVLLRNGAEIFRVEETIAHICNHYGLEEVDAFVLSNGIFLTAHNEGEEMFAKVKHVPMAGTHLGIVTEVNNLSREIVAGKVELDEAFERLKDIEQMPSNNLRLVLGAGIGSAMFCYLLKGNVYECIVTVGVASLLYMLILLAQKQHISKIITNLVGGAFITIMAIIAARLPIPWMIRRDHVIIGCILPMIPGVAFVNAIRDIADSDFISGIVKMLDAFLVFVYIAIGVGLVLSFMEGGIWL